MTVGNYTEVLGTPESETLTGSDLEVVYGLTGDDLLSPAEDVLGVNSPTPPIFVGGTGADEYTVLNDSVLWILDAGNSSGDVLDASGISLSESSFAEIEGQHLFMVDVNSRQSIYIFDWQEATNQIETFEFSDGTVDYDSLVDELTSRGDGFGNFAWSDPGVAPDERTGLSANTVESAIDDLLDRAQELEGIVGENPNLDLDGNGTADALTDGVLALRFLFGFRGDTLIEGAIASDATRTTDSEIETYLEQIASSTLDLDGNGMADALSDGVLGLRYLFGFRGNTLTEGAIASDATRNTATDLEAYLGSIAAIA